MVSEKEARQIVAGLVKRYAALSIRRGWTTEQAAQRIGVNRNSWFTMRSGARPMISLMTYLNLEKQVNTADKA